MSMTLSGDGTITGLVAGGLPSATVTQTTLDNSVVPIGVGQTWQDVKASRALGTTYTNTTGKTIAVSISCSNAGSSGATGFGITVNGVALGYTYIIQQTGAGNYYTQAFAIVPNGATYTTASSAISATLTQWAELR